jgi:hypothetical protein
MLKCIGGPCLIIFCSSCKGTEAYDEEISTTQTESSQKWLEVNNISQDEYKIKIIMGCPSHHKMITLVSNFVKKEKEKKGGGACHCLHLICA